MMKHIFIVKSQDEKAQETVAKLGEDLDCRIIKVSIPSRIKEMIAPYLEGDNRFYVLGGDGMIHYVVQALAHQNGSLAIVPRGTGNDFARNFVIDKDLEKNIRSCIEQEPIAVDLIKANDIYIANTLCFGIDSDCANHVHRQKIVRFLPGGLFYAKMTLQRLFKFAGFAAKISGGTTDVSGKFVLGVVANGRYYGGGYQIGNGLVDDGYFELGYLLGDSKLKAALKLLKLPLNKILQDREYHHSIHRKLVVTTAGLVNIDGETYPCGKYVVEIEPQALRILNPLKKPN